MATFHNLGKCQTIPGLFFLQNELSKHFESFSEVDYTEILADTYYFQKNETFEEFISKLKKFKN